MRRQRGSILIMGAAGLAVATAALLVIDVAQLFAAKRALQKAADAAALAAVQMLDGGCTQPPLTARDIAEANGLPAAGAATTECGSWAVDDRTQTPQALSNYFVAGAPATGDYNAVRVQLERDVPYFMVFNGSTARRIRAEATAAGRPVDAFAVGSGLFGLSDASPVNRLLSAMLGTSVNLSLVSYQGLASARFRLLDLVEAAPLNLGTVDELLASNVRLGDLLLASANAMSASDAASASVLQALALQAPNVNIAMADLLAVDSPTSAAAGEARLSAFDVLMTAAQIANRNNFLDLGTMINVPGVANVSMQAVLIEPPQIAVGGVGATARTAQLRARLNIQALNTTLGLVSLSALNLPVVLEGMPASATLRSMRCGATAESSNVGIDATSGVLRACVSGVTTANLGTAATPCSTPATLTQVSVLGVGLVSVRGSASVDLTDPGVESLKFGAEGPAGSTVDGSVQRIDSAPASTVGNALGTLVGDLTLSTQPAVLGALINPTLNAVDSLLTSTLANPTLTAALDAQLAPVLRLLGVSVGFADVHQIDLRCSRTDLVY